MCAAECHRLKSALRFVAFRGQFKSKVARSVAFRGQSLPRSWHSAVHLDSGGWHSAVCLRAECHRSKTPMQFVAFHGEFERGA
jgi:hypothetical protein